MPEPAPILTDAEREFIVAARTATLATTSPNGRPRLVPVCFVLFATDGSLDKPRLYTPLDEKPKRGAEPRDLARVRDLLARPEATLLVDRWDEDWSRLAWVRLYGRGDLVEPAGRALAEHAAAVSALRAKYPQYRDHALDSRPMIRVSVSRSVSWGRVGD